MKKWVNHIQRAIKEIRLSCRDEENMPLDVYINLKKIEDELEEIIKKKE